MHPGVRTPVVRSRKKPQRTGGHRACRHRHIPEGLHERLIAGLLRLQCGLKAETEQ
jgi:hypothetical protein